MKNTIKLAVVAALAFSATSVFATNGSTMLGMGAKTRGMGGVGIGMSHGAESVLANPSLITSVKSNEISFGGTIFMPDVESTNDMAPGGSTPTKGTSTADMFVIPAISLVTKINDNFYTGVGMWGTGGLGVDFRNTTSGYHMNMVTALSLMQFGVPLAFKTAGFSAAITPLIQYGTLDINYDTNATNHVGSGVGSDLSFGYTLGLSYETSGLTVGAVYKSEIEMKYDGVLSTAVQGFGVASYTNDTLSSPAEIGLGASYALGKHTIALDYKVIQWSDAAGYKDFGWEDQDVIAVGYEYASDAWAIRAGYSKADSAVQDNNGKNLAIDVAANGGAGGNLTNTFNILGFPGNIEEHYTIGGTINATEAVSVDLAYVYAPENTSTFKNVANNNATVKHSETSYSVQLNVAF
ncbi:outer membrane protein transport protein [Sulfurimonas sp.]|nr:outer membrane protein transport protein [Sulfurimonas sp.]